MKTVWEKRLQGIIIVILTNLTKRTIVAKVVINGNKIKFQVHFDGEWEFHDDLSWVAAWSNLFACERFN